eukprot:s3521_g2.t1
MHRCETLHADAVQQLRNKSEELLKRLADLDGPSPWIQVKGLFEPQGLGASRSKVVMYCKAEEFAHAMYALFLRHIPWQDQLANLHAGLPVGEERAETRSQVDSLTAERAKVLEARTGIRDALSIDDEEFAEIQQKYEAAALSQPPFVAPMPSTTEAGSSNGEDSGGVSASSSDAEIVATIKVHCKSWASSFEMELLSEATVQGLKELIREELGESSEQQLKLIFKGDALEDSLCVKDLGIAEDEFLVVDKAQEVPKPEETAAAQPKAAETAAAELRIPRGKHCALQDAEGSEDAPRLLGSLKASGGRGDSKDIKAKPEAEEEAQRQSALFLFGKPFVDDALMEDMSEALPAVKELVQKAKSVCGDYNHKRSGCMRVFNGVIASLAELAKFRDDMHQAASKASFYGSGPGGVLAALCAAGVLAFEDGLRIAQLADNAVSAQAGGKKQRMILISGFGAESVLALCQKATAMKDGDVCAISGYAYLDRNEFLVSGTEEAVCKFEELAKARPGHCTVVTESNVAYCCSLMQTAQGKFNAELDSQLPAMSSPTATVWISTTAKTFRPGADPKEILVELKRILTSPILERQCADAALEDGVVELYNYNLRTKKIEKKQLQRLPCDDEIPICY